MIFPPVTYDVDLELRFLSYLIFDNSSNLFGIEEVDFSHSLTKKVFNQVKSGVILNPPKLVEIGLPERFVEFMLDNLVYSSAEMERISGQLKGLSYGRREISRAELHKQKILKANVSDLMTASKAGRKQYLLGYDEFCEAVGNEPKKIPIKFEPSCINEWIEFFNTKWLAIIFASTGVGKTSFAMQIARSIAEHECSSLLYFSLEMDKVEYAERAYSIMYYMDNPKASREDWNKHFNALSNEEMVRTAGRKNELLVDEPNLTIEEIRDYLKEAKRIKPDIRTVVIDHIYLIKESAGTKTAIEHESKLSSQLDALAKEFDVRILAVGQTRKADEDGKFKEPILEDIRGAKALSENLWWAIALWLDKTDKNLIYWKIAKKRGGEGVGKKGILMCRGTYFHDDFSHFNNPNY